MEGSENIPQKDFEFYQKIDDLISDSRKCIQKGQYKKCVMLCEKIYEKNRSTILKDQQNIEICKQFVHCTKKITTISGSKQLLHLKKSIFQLLSKSQVMIVVWYKCLISVMQKENIKRVYINKSENDKSPKRENTLVTNSIINLRKIDEQNEKIYYYQKSSLIHLADLFPDKNQENSILHNININSNIFDENKLVQQEHYHLLPFQQKVKQELKLFLLGLIDVLDCLLMYEKESGNKEGLKEYLLFIKTIIESEQIQKTQDADTMNRVSSLRTKILAVMVEQNMFQIGIQFGENSLNIQQNYLNVLYKLRQKIITFSKQSEIEFYKNYQNNFIHICQQSQDMCALLFNLALCYEQVRNYEKMIESLNIAMFFCQKYMFNEQDRDYEEIYYFLQHFISRNKIHYKKEIKEEREINRVMEKFNDLVGIKKATNQQEINPFDLVSYYNQRAYNKFNYEQINQSLVIRTSPNRKIKKSLKNTQKKGTFNSQQNLRFGSRRTTLSAIQAFNHINKSQGDQDIDIKQKQSCSLLQSKQISNNQSQTFIDIKDKDNFISIKNLSKSNNTQYKSIGKIGNQNIDTKSEQIKILGKIQENTQETNGLDESEKYFSDQFDNSNKTLNQDDTKNGQTYSSDKMHKTQPCQQTNNKTQLENDQVNNYFSLSKFKNPKRNLNISQNNQSTRISSSNTMTTANNSMRQFNSSQINYKTSHFQNSHNYGLKSTKNTTLQLDTNSSSFIYNIDYKAKQKMSMRDRIQQQHQNYLTKKNNEQKNINENKDKGQNIDLMIDQLKNIDNDIKEYYYYQDKEKKQYDPGEIYGIYPNNQQWRKEKKLLYKMQQLNDCSKKQQKQTQEIQNQNMQQDLDDNMKSQVIERLQSESDFRSYKEVYKYQTQLLKSDYSLNGNTNMDKFQIRWKNKNNFITKNVQKKALQESLFNIQNQVYNDGDLNLQRFRMETRKIGGEEENMKKKTIQQFNEDFEKYEQQDEDLSDEQLKKFSTKKQSERILSIRGILCSKQDPEFKNQKQKNEKPIVQKQTEDQSSSIYPKNSNNNIQKKRFSTSIFVKSKNIQQNQQIDQKIPTILKKNRFDLEFEENLTKEEMIQQIKRDNVLGLQSLLHQKQQDILDLTDKQRSYYIKKQKLENMKFQKISQQSQTQKSVKQINDFKLNQDIQNKTPQSIQVQTSFQNKIDEVMGDDGLLIKEIYRQKQIQDKQGYYNIDQQKQLQKTQKNELEQINNVYQYPKLINDSQNLINSPQSKNYASLQRETDINSTQSVIQNQHSSYRQVKKYRTIGEALVEQNSQLIKSCNQFRHNQKQKQKVLNVFKTNKDINLSKENSIDTSRGRGQNDSKLNFKDLLANKKIINSNKSKSDILES